MKTQMTPATEAAKQDAAVDLAIAAIRKQFGQGSIQCMGSDEALRVEILPTGCLSADIALGVGGLPRGRIVEIFGPESSGKTTFCLTAIAAAQRLGGRAAIIDVEHALECDWARRCGVDVDRLLVSQPDSGEDALSIAEALVRSGAVELVVVDSVAALVPKSELDGQMGDASVGAQARLMGQAMRRLTAALSRSHSILLFTNQIRERIGVLYGSPEYQPGGRALKFFASVRLDIRRKDQIKSPEGTVLGNRTRLKVVKNKVAAPFAECEFDLLFAEGISRHGTLLDLGIETGVLEKKGAWIMRNSQVIGQGRDASKYFLAEHPDIADEIEAELRERRLKICALEERQQSPEAPATDASRDGHPEIAA